MKIKVEVSLVLALLMIVSTFAVGAVDITTNDGEDGGDNGSGGNSAGCYSFGSVVKMIYGGEGNATVVDLIESEIGDTLRFKITLTYHETDHENAAKAINIVAVDTLPDCLEYANSAVPEPSNVSGKIITWEFDEELFEADSIIIEFNATVVDYTDEDGEENLVRVTALEKCSDRPLCGRDTATVKVIEEPCIPRIEVDKKVLVEDEWVDSIDGLELNDVVTFKVNVKYLCGEDTILCLNAEDYLPCCLEYAGNLEIVASWDDLKEPVIKVSPNNKTLTISWLGGDSYVEMKANDSLEFTFDAIVKNYCEVIDYNEVHVNGWTCVGCEQVYYDYDKVEVDCSAPITTFDKLIYFNGSWFEEFNVSTLSTHQFKLELTYYGLETLEEIQFVDVLPCILEYRQDITAWLSGPYKKDDEIISENEIIPYLTNDNKTVMFNLTNVSLEHGETVSVTFSAKVTGTTDSCGCECDKAINYGYVYGNIFCPQSYLIMSDEVVLRSSLNCPPSIPLISGPTYGVAGNKLTFNVLSYDPNGDQIYGYGIEWGDGTYSEITGPFNSSEKQTLTHVFNEAGTYKLRAHCADVKYAESGWTPIGFEFVVVITEEKIELNFDIKTFGIGHVRATIKNIGEVDLKNIDYKISITGGLLNRINVSHNCTIDELDVDEKYSLTSGPRFGAGSIKFAKFGRINGEITAGVNGYEKTQTFKGFVIGKLVIINGFSI